MSTRGTQMTVLYMKGCRAGNGILTTMRDFGKRGGLDESVEVGGYGV